MKRAFISHISEEMLVAERLKHALVKDFLGLLDVFVSSDKESVAAGENWLRSIETALRECAVVVILCSPESIRRPWINFEAGAAWIREIPLIPVCHSDLLPQDLPMPLSLRQGIVLSEAEGLRRLYARIASVLSCHTPDLDFLALADRLCRDLEPAATPVALSHLASGRTIRIRLEAALRPPNHKWRTLSALCAEAGVSEEQGADTLRAEPAVRFSRAKSGSIIVGLRARVGEVRIGLHNRNLRDPNLETPTLRGASGRVITLRLGRKGLIGSDLELIQTRLSSYGVMAEEIIKGRKRNEIDITISPPLTQSKIDYIMEGVSSVESYSVSDVE